MKKSQNQLILSHLQYGRTINPLQALHFYGCLRLARVVHDLKRDGHEIKTEIVKDLTTGKRYAQYKLS